jgi:hypothetical protein
MPNQQGIFLLGRRRGSEHPLVAHGLKPAVTCCNVTDPLPRPLTSPNLELAGAQLLGPGCIGGNEASIQWAANEIPDMCKSPRQAACVVISTALARTQPSARRSWMGGAVQPVGEGGQLSLGMDREKNAYCCGYVRARFESLSQVYVKGAGQVENHSRGRSYEIQSLLPRKGWNWMCLSVRGRECGKRVAKMQTRNRLPPTTPYTYH